MPSPAVTITGTIQDIFGNADAAAIVQFTLVNYDNQIPVVSGTSILAQIQQQVTVNSSGAFSATLWGNDVITPASTYYVVTFLSSPGVVVRQVPYRFVGSGTFDLSTVLPFQVTPAPPLPLIPVVTNPPGGGLQSISGPLSVGALNLSGPITAPAFTFTTHGDRQIILSNPDFEGSTIIPPPGWTLVPGTTVSYETASPAPGKLQSLKIATTGQFGQIVSANHYSVIPGDVYSMTAQVKSDGTGIPTIAITPLDKNGAGLSSIIFLPGTTSTSWNTLTAYGTVPSNAVSIIVQVENTAVSQPSAVWCDTISVQKLNTPGPVTAPAYSITTRGDRQVVISNPDFEGSTLTPPPGWALGTNTTFAYETTSPAPGKLQSAKLSTTVQFGSMFQVGPISVAPGDVYAVSGMSKSDGNGIPSIQLNCHDKNGTFTTAIQTGIGTATSWTFAEAIGTIPAGTVQAVVNLSNGAALAQQPSSCWFDQISIRKIDFPEISFQGSTSGSTVLSPQATASGTLSLPAATDTLVARATTDTLSNKTLASPVITGTASGSATIPPSMLNSTTGSGAVVLASGPSIASPTITGTAAGASTIPPTMLNSITGSGAAVLASSPSISTPTLSSPAFSGTASGASNIPTGLIVPGSNGQVLITTSGAAAWGTGAGLVSPQINTTTVTVNGNTTSDQTLQSVTFTGGAFNSNGKAFMVKVGGIGTAVNTTEVFSFKLVVGSGSTVILSGTPTTTSGWGWSADLLCAVVTASTGAINVVGPSVTSQSITTGSGVGLTAGSLSGSLTISITVAFTTASTSNIVSSITLAVVPIN